MVYESDFYTTRRPYRPSPNLSSYTVSSYVPSRQIRILPGIGKVHVVHSYDRLIPYIGHKRLTVVTTRSPHVFRVRPSVIIREIDRIQHKTRPFVYYSPTSHYLNSEAKTMFDDETRLIRAESASLLKRIHAPVTRVHTRSWPVTTVSRYPYVREVLPARITSDDYVYRMLTPIRNIKQDIYNISHYNTDPLCRKFIGGGHLACVRYGGDKGYSRRRNLTVQEIYSMQSDTVRNDIQLLSYYIKSNKDRKTHEIETATLPSLRPSRVFSPRVLMLEPSNEIKELREQRAERLAKIHAVDEAPMVEDAGSRIKRATKQKEEERLAEERALAEEQMKKEEQAKKDNAARKAELARQEALAAQAAAERAAEMERRAEQAKKEEEAKKAEEKRAAEAARLEAEKAEKVRLEEEKKQAELARQEEERQQLLRLEEIARQAEEEKEKELARQAAELAELARQEAELAEQARLEAEEAEMAELAKKEAELAELEKQEKELAELDKKERELAELAKHEDEMEEMRRQEEELAAAEADVKAMKETEEEECQEPTVEEPVTPDVQTNNPTATAEEVEEDDEEEEEEEEEED